MIIFPFTFDDIGSTNVCDWCKKTIKKGFFINASTHDDWEVMKKIFWNFLDTPVLVCCNECLNGKSPEVFLKESFDNKFLFVTNRKKRW